MVNVKILTIFIITIALIQILSINLNAADFPSSGTDEEKQKWILDNPDNIDLRDLEQKETVENYLVNQGTISANNDRKFLEDLMRYHTLDKVQIDLSKGQGISLKKEDNNLFLVSSDNQKWNLDVFNSLSIGEKKLDKIQSRDDGTIDLFFGEDSIHLKDNVIKTDTFGRLILNDGTILGLKNGFGKLDVQENSIGCLSVKCIYSIGFMEFELKQNGIFNNLGGNRFSVLDGKMKIGNSLLSGNFELSTDKDRKNLGDKAAIGKINDKAKNIDSSIQTDSKDYGKTEIRSSSSDKVIACFDCTDFIKHVEKYDGYVHLKKSELCYADFVSCENLFSSEIKGKVGVKFQNDAGHLGTDRNLLLTFDSSPSQAGFKLQSCDGCKEGEVAFLDLNGQPFRIKNKIEEGKQNFDIIQMNPAFPITEDYTRNINIINEKGDVTNVYSVRSDSFVAMEKVTQDEIDEYKKYRDLAEKRAAAGLNIINKLSENDKTAFSLFVEDMKTGRDGNIPVIGEYIPRENERIIQLQPQGRFMVIRNPEIIKMIDSGKISVNELILFGEYNNKVIAYENTKRFNEITKIIFKSLVPESLEEVTFNVATLGTGQVLQLTKGAKGVYRAVGLTETLLASGKLGLKTGAALTIGFVPETAPLTIAEGSLKQIPETKTLLQIAARKTPELKFILPETGEGLNKYYDDIARYYEREMGLSVNSLSVHPPTGVPSDSDVIILKHTGTDGVTRDALAVKIFTGNEDAAFREAGILTELTFSDINSPKVVDIINTAYPGISKPVPMLVTEIAPGDNIANLIQEATKLKGPARNLAMVKLESQIENIGTELGKFHNTLSPSELSKSSDILIREKALEMKKALEASLNNNYLSQRDFDIIKNNIENLENDLKQSLKYVRSHGDFHGGNVHVTPDGKATIFDVEKSEISTLGYDLWKFTGSIDSYGNAASVPVNQIGRLKSSFLKSYSAKTGIPVETLEKNIEFVRLEQKINNILRHRGISPSLFTEPSLDDLMEGVQ